MKKLWLKLKKEQGFIMSVVVLLLTCRVCLLEDNVLLALVEFIVGISVTLVLNPKEVIDLADDSD